MNPERFLYQRHPEDIAAEQKRRNDTSIPVLFFAQLLLENSAEQLRRINNRIVLEGQDSAALQSQVLEQGKVQVARLWLGSIVFGLEAARITGEFSIRHTVARVNAKIADTLIPYYDLPDSTKKPLNEAESKRLQESYEKDNTYTDAIRAEILPDECNSYMNGLYHIPGGISDLRFLIKLEALTWRNPVREFLAYNDAQEPDVLPEDWVRPNLEALRERKIFSEAELSALVALKAKAEHPSA